MIRLSTEELIELFTARMEAMSDEERVSALYHFLEQYCQHCGSSDGYRCVCMKDE